MPNRDRLETHYLLHAVTGELHWRLKQLPEAAASFRRALHLAHVGPEQVHLTRMLERSSEPPLHPGENGRRRTLGPEAV